MSISKERKQFTSKEKKFSSKERKKFTSKRKKPISKKRKKFISKEKKVQLKGEKSLPQKRKKFSSKEKKVQLKGEKSSPQMRARPASQETLRFPPKQRPTVSQLQASWEDSQTIRNKNQRTLIVRRAGLSNPEKMELDLVSITKYKNTQLRFATGWTSLLIVSRGFRHRPTPPTQLPTHCQLLSD